MSRSDGRLVSFSAGFKGKKLLETELKPVFKVVRRKIPQIYSDIQVKNQEDPIKT